ncbi:MAG: inositol-3-phosphate synthase, partial [Thermoproteota archaeon]
MPGRKVRVALIGIGNSASIFVQGLLYYSSSPEKNGLWHPKVGGYGVEDIEVVAALDIDSEKVGKDLSEAIFIKPNSVERKVNVPRTGVVVEKGLLEDFLNPYLKTEISPISQSIDGVADYLKSRNVDVAVNIIS